MRKRVLLAAAGGLGSLLLWWLSPLRDGDPFQTTFICLPALAAGFALLERCGPGRRLSPAARTAHTLALATLSAAVLARGSLGVRYAETLVDRSLAAALALLLAHRVMAQVVALRPALGRNLPRSPPVAFFALPLLVYLAILPWASSQRPPDGDEPFNLLVAHSLAYDFDIDLANNYAEEDYRAFVDRDLEPQPGDPTGPDGAVYSRHNALLPLVLAPAYRIFGLAGALATMACLAAALAWATLRLARHYLARRPGDALLAWAVTSFTAPILLFSYQAWVEIPAALLLALSLEAVLRARSAIPARGHGFLALVGIVLLPLLKLRFVLVAVPLLALAVLQRRRRRFQVRTWVPLALLAALVISILALNLAWFDNPLKYHHLEQLVAYTSSLTAYALGASGLFFDCAFGLVAAAPVWLLLVPSLLRPELRLRRLWLHIALIAGPTFVAVAPRGEWYGAWSPPFRYGVVALPLLGLALAPCLRKRGLPAVVVKILGWLTLALTVTWLTWPEWTYNLAHGGSHLLDALGGRMGVDVARLFPSSIRPRAATWIWPACVLALGLLPWRSPRGARRPRGRRLSPAAGVAGTVGVATACLLAAAFLPTRTIEAEDAWVRHSGGAIYPARWVIGRRRFRGGWLTPPGTQFEAPVASGGRRLSIVVEARPMSPRLARSELTIRIAGEQVAVASLSPSGGWQEVELGPFTWPDRRRASLAVRAAGERGTDSGALIDRIRLRWH